jgi:uncharacterized damage-inducible protein DinB
MPDDESLPQRWSAATVHDDLWTDPEDDPRETGVSPVGERQTLLQYLDAYRHTLRLKCEGLSAEQLALRSVPPSTMSLLGLVRHVAEVERSWTRRTMLAEDAPQLYCTPEDPDGDFDGAVGDQALVDQAFADWRAEQQATDALVADSDDLGRMSASTRQSIALREVLVHLIEEYARHCGHADLLRERIDGRVGQ